VVLIGSVQATDKENQTMADNLSMALAELLRKADAEPDVDTLREGGRTTDRANATATAIGAGIRARRTNAAVST
jgi:hypothetical protein